MRLNLPSGRHIRLFERVETTDPQYYIYDVGLEHANGGIDSIAAGGSFHTARTAYDAWMDSSEKKAKKKAAKKAARKARKAAKVETTDEVVEA